MSTDMPRASSLGLVILGTLLEEPMHAYRMQKLIRQRGKHKVVNVRRGASVYQVLERLVRLGLIEVQATVQTESHPDRIIYKITGQGRDTARTWLRQMLTTIGDDFPDFPAAVSGLAMLTPEDARRQFEIRADAIRMELRKLEADKKAAGDLPRLFLLEDAYRTAVLEAELAWLNSVIADFKTGSLTWSEAWVRDIAAKFMPPEDSDATPSAGIEAPAIKTYRAKASTGKRAVAKPPRTRRRPNSH